MPAPLECHLSRENQVYKSVAANCLATTMALELNCTASSTPHEPQGRVTPCAPSCVKGSPANRGVLCPVNVPGSGEQFVSLGGSWSLSYRASKRVEENALPNLRQFVKFVSSLVPAFRVRSRVKLVFVNLLARRCALKVPPCAFLRVFAGGRFPPSSSLPNPMLGLRPWKFSSPTKGPYAQHRNPSPIH